jgi:diguanylate cyclase (GGDEF)-like protein/putative nucleotidyltransferase with HDIG domain
MLTPLALTPGTERADTALRYTPLPSLEHDTSRPQRMPAHRRSYEAAVERMSEETVRTRAQGGFFVSGGLLALISLLLPHPPEVFDAGVLAIGSFACVSGALLLLKPQVMPPHLLTLVLACGNLLISIGVWFSHSSESVYALLYVWVGFQAAYFFPRRHAAVHVAATGVTYAGALALVPGSDRAERWLLLFGTVVVISLMVAVLRERVERLIGRLADAARTDPLTGLLNRRGFQELMEVETERALRSSRPLAIVVGDLDHFKHLNDRFGHAAGDLALRRFGEIATFASRRIDAVARIGGEEFALLLPDTEQHAAYLLAERLRRAVKEPSADGDLPTVSFGVASFPTHAADAEALMHAADQALYAAKAMGRDRSVIYNPEVLASVLGGQLDPVAGNEHLSAVLVLAETLDLRDSGTASHSQTVGRLAALIAKALGLDDARVERIRLAGILHDIGKIGIPDWILHKPGPLEEGEWAEVCKHPEMGARMAASAQLDDISEWILSHHERVDGTGYPRALPARMIPIEAKILAVADSYEAMTADRVYRPAMPAEEAEQELRRHAGTQFDPAVVDALLGAIAVEPASTR